MTEIVIFSLNNDDNHWVIYIQNKDQIQLHSFYSSYMINRGELRRKELIIVYAPLLFHS
jgi:hypothetical protein